MIDFNAAPFYIIHNIPFPIYKNVFVFFNVSKKIARLLVSIVILYSQQGMQQLEKRFAGENYESTVLTPFGSYFEQNSNEQKKKMETEQHTQIMIECCYIFSTNRHFDDFK